MEIDERQQAAARAALAQERLALPREAVHSAVAAVGKATRPLLVKRSTKISVARAIITGQAVHSAVIPFSFS